MSDRLTSGQLKDVMERASLGICHFDSDTVLAISRELTAFREAGKTPGVVADAMAELERPIEGPKLEPYTIPMFRWPRRGDVVATQATWLYHEREAARQQVRDLMKLVREVEWARNAARPDGGTYRACPICGGGDPSDNGTPAGHRGHREGCRLPGALDPK